MTMKGATTFVSGQSSPNSAHSTDLSLFDRNPQQALPLKESVLVARDKIEIAPKAPVGISTLHSQKAGNESETMQSRTKVRTKVSFACDRVKVVENYKALPLPIKCTIWFTRRELTAIRHETYWLAKHYCTGPPSEVFNGDMNLTALKQGRASPMRVSDDEKDEDDVSDTQDNDDDHNVQTDHDGDHLDEICLRGLESRSSRGSRERNTHRTIGLAAVIGEQARQRSENPGGIVDQSIVARLYKACSVEPQQIAYALGFQDQLDVFYLLQPHHHQQQPRRLLIRSESKRKRIKERSSSPVSPVLKKSTLQCESLMTVPDVVDPVTSNEQGYKIQRDPNETKRSSHDNAQGDEGCSTHVSDKKGQASQKEEMVVGPLCTTTHHLNDDDQEQEEENALDDLEVREGDGSSLSCETSGGHRLLSSPRPFDLPEREPDELDEVSHGHDRDSVAFYDMHELLLLKKSRAKKRLARLQSHRAALRDAIPSGKNSSLLRRTGLVQ